MKLTDYFSSEEIMVNKASSQPPKVRVKRDNKLRWIGESEVLPGEDVFPLPPRSPALPTIGRIEFGVDVDDEILPVPVPSPPDLMDVLRQMQADMAAIREENAALRTDLATVTRDVKRGGKGVKRAAVGLPKRRPDGEYPIPYYNPITMDERFQDTPEQSLGPGVRVGYQSFRNGVFYAHDAQQERIVRKALLGWGPDKPDRWKGDDLSEMESCKSCGFRSFNRRASNDHLNRYTDHRFERHEE